MNPTTIASASVSIKRHERDCVLRKLARRST